MVPHTWNTLLTMKHLHYLMYLLLRTWDAIMLRQLGILVSRNICSICKMLETDHGKCMDLECVVGITIQSKNMIKGKQLKVAICDDEKYICLITEKLLMKYVENTSREITYHIYLSGEELLSSEENYDIVLLDIELKNENGFEIAALLRERSRAKIIFITSYIEEMPNGYKVREFCV